MAQHYHTCIIVLAACIPSSVNPVTNTSIAMYLPLLAFTLFSDCMFKLLMVVLVQQHSTTPVLNLIGHCRECSFYGRGRVCCGLRTTASAKLLDVKPTPGRQSNYSFSLVSSSKFVNRRIFGNKFECATSGFIERQFLDNRGVRVRAPAQALVRPTDLLCSARIDNPWQQSTSGVVLLFSITK